MSVEEFHRWYAWVRLNPVGLHWERYKQASLEREVNRTIPRKGGKLPSLKHFMWNPPPPLAVLAAEAAAKRSDNIQKDSP